MKKYKPKYSFCLSFNLNIASRIIILSNTLLNGSYVFSSCISFNRGYINFETLKMGIIYGSVLASFTVEEFGVNALLAVTSDSIKDRIEKFIELTRFEWNEKQNKI